MTALRKKIADSLADHVRVHGPSSIRLDPVLLDTAVEHCRLLAESDAAAILQEAVDSAG